MIRQVLAVIAGYAIFVFTSLALFKVSGVAPHSDASTGFILFTVAYGAVCSLVSGFVTKLIAKTSNLTISYILAFVIAAFAAFSFFKSDGSHWTQLLAIFVFAPVSVLGGLLYLRRP